MEKSHKELFSEIVTEYFLYLVSVLGQLVLCPKGRT